MKQLFLSALALLLSATTTQAQVSNNNEDGVYKISARHASLDFVPGEVLVKFRDGSPVTVRRARGKYQSSDNASLDAVLQSFGVEEMEKLLPDEQPGQRARKTRAPNGSEISDHDLSQLYRLRMAQAEIGKTTELVEQLATLPEVEYAEPNYRAYIMGGETISQNPEQNPSYPLQWGITSLKINELWTKPIVNPSRPIIAILDTGVDTTHPDLKDNIWGGGGYDFINETTDIRDYNSHGTHVAGIAAAVDNGEGIIGANPQALIMPVTVMQSDGTGDIATIIRGIDYAVQNGATVLNMSLGTYINSKAMRQALERAYQTAVIVAAAGNDDAFIDAPCFPAAYSFVLGVQALSTECEKPYKTDYWGRWLTNFSNGDENPYFSDTKDEWGDDGCNYEMSAAGRNILSTVPNGGYKQYSGTSMAAPFIAGAVSALQMVKNYDTQEMLWCDLTHTPDFLSAYNLTDYPAELDLLGIQYNDRRELGEEEESTISDEDGHIDAGEVIRIYPIVRTAFGEAHNIKLHLEMGDEYEDSNLVTFIENDVDFGWNLSPYGKQVSQNPLIFKVREDCIDNRHIRLRMRITCDEITNSVDIPFAIVVENTIKLGGMLENDMTLTPNHHYQVSSNLAIPEGVTLTIMPGTNVRIRPGQGISCSGKIVADGKPDSLINFSVYGDIISKVWSLQCSSPVSMSYCRFSRMRPGLKVNNRLKLENCIITNSIISISGSEEPRAYLTRCLVYDNNISHLSSAEMNNTNIANNSLVTTSESLLPSWDELTHVNYIGATSESGYVMGFYSKEPAIQKTDNPSWLGTAKESVIRPYVADIENGVGFGKIDLSNMLTEPIHEAHGIVWKVVVNGYDAQDEYDMLPPLGIGRHKFEVWYNRPMNKAVAPQISFGVREPYTQNAVEEDGAWNEDGTIYTAYATITSRTASDGVNRIYVYGGEDDEHFECPYEKSRFNINIQAASSMSTGFSAEGRGDHITLTWNNTENDIDDAMGYNIYRYTERTVEELVYDEKGNKIWDDERNDWQTVEIIVRDTIRINPYVIDIDATSYTDRAVTDEETYYYFYKLQGTNLKEYGMSNTVRATTSTSGIAIISADERRGSNRYYDLSGRRLNMYPAKKGVYIIGRKKVVLQ